MGNTRFDLVIPRSHAAGRGRGVGWVMPMYSMTHLDNDPTTTASRWRAEIPQPDPERVHRYPFLRLANRVADLLQNERPPRSRSQPLDPRHARILLGLSLAIMENGSRECLPRGLKYLPLAPLVDWFVLDATFLHAHMAVKLVKAAPLIAPSARHQKQPSHLFGSPAKSQEQCDWFRRLGLAALGF